MQDEQRIDAIKSHIMDGKKTDELCPTCGCDLYEYYEGTSPDDYDIALMCPACFYFERL